MWKVALVCLFLCSAVSAARYPRNATVAVCDGDSNCQGECPAGHVAVDGKCLELAKEAGDACEVQEQCFNGSACVAGKCEIEPLRQACNSSADCDGTAGFVCEKGECRCAGETVLVGQACLKTALDLGDACEHDLQCDAHNATCSAGVCRYDNPTGLCKDENSEVVDETCVCKGGFVQADDGKSCLKAAKLGEACTSGKQCERVNGTCVGGVCAETVVSAGTNSLEKIQISSKCAGSDDCNGIPGAVCKEGTCQCDDGHVSRDNLTACLPLAKPGEECETDKQCSGMISCIGGKCAAVQTAGFRNGSRKMPVSSLILVTGLLIACRTNFRM